MISYFDVFESFSFLNNWVFTFYFLSIILILSIILFILNYNVIPTRYNFILEKISFLFLKNLKTVNVNLMYFIFIIFFVILIFNFNGLIVYSYPYTTHFSLTFFLSFSSWIGIILYSIYLNKINFFSSFMPQEAPLWLSSLLVIIEIISSFARPLALGLRLAANLTAGHLLLGILSNFGFILLCYFSNFYNIIIIIFLLLFITMEIFIALVQSVVFCLLLEVYLNDALEIH